MHQQRRAAEAYCAEGHYVLGRCFVDEARAGGTVVGREAFDEMMAYLRRLAPAANKRNAEAPDGVLFWDLKRFARNALESSFFKADLRLRGYAVVFLSDNIPAGDIGMVYEAMLEWKAQQDLADIAKDASRGLKDLVSTRGPDGRYLGLCPGRTPTGFRGEPYVLGVKRDGTPRVVQRLVPDPETWALCRRAWEMKVGGASGREIHVATRLLGSINSYTTFFRNRIYTGRLEYGGRVFDDFVPRLIPDEWFEQVQANRRPKSVHGPPAASDYLLSEVLHCGLCGSAMAGDSIPAREDAGDGYGRARYRRYVCTRWKNKRDCAMHYVPADRVEAAVFDALVNRVLQEEVLLQVLADGRLDVAARESLQREVRRLERELEAVGRTISRLVDAVEKAGYSASIEQRLAERERERAVIEMDLGTARRGLAAADTEIPRGVVADFCRNARTVIEAGAPDDVRGLLRTLIVRIELDPEGGGRIVYSFPLDWRG